MSEFFKNFVLGFVLGFGVPFVVCLTYYVAGAAWYLAENYWSKK